MFNKETKEINIKEAETVIGPQVRLKGNFHGEGNVIIEGIVEGDIKTSNFLLIGSKAVITANIQAKDAKISGEIKGNVVINDYLEVTSTAKIVGDIECSQISIEKGAMLNGNCSMGKNQSSHNTLQS